MPPEAPTGGSGQPFLQPNVDEARRPQLGVAANPYSQPNADVAREPQLGVAANHYSQLNADVARKPQQGVATNSEPGREVDVARRPQPIATNSWADTVSTEVGDSSTQATAERATGSRPFYTDFWALLADAGYEAWWVG